MSRKIVCGIQTAAFRGVSDRRRERADSIFRTVSMNQPYLSCPDMFAPLAVSRKRTTIRPIRRPCYKTTNCGGNNTIRDFHSCCPQPEIANKDASVEGWTSEPSSARSNLTNLENNPKKHRRVWKANPDNKEQNELKTLQNGSPHTPVSSSSSILYWNDRVIDQEGGGNIDALVQRIRNQDGQGAGRMRENQLGVLHADPTKDMQMLVNNYTVKAVASALRDREDALQQAAVLAADGRIEELQAFLQMFHPKYVLERRRLQKQTKSFMKYDSNNDDAATLDDSPVASLHTDASRQLLRKALMRMPRTITTAHTKRAAVCLALCLSNGVPSILLEKRAATLKSHPDEVSLPGGMVCDIQDQTIVSTSIREMKEEIGGLNDVDNGGMPIEIIGILRLNWGDVHHLTGIAVTPVVCYLGELPEMLHPNPDEVAEVFTVPLVDLLDSSLWVHPDGLAPIFIGGPHVIWGLTGYILQRFALELARLNYS